jgi:hypothetical protein
MKRMALAALLAAGTLPAAEAAAGWEVKRARRLSGNYNFSAEGQMPEACLDYAMDSLQQAIGDSRFDCTQDFGPQARFYAVGPVQETVNEESQYCKVTQNTVCVAPCSYQGR